MILIAGLGNPDVKYKNNRHNVGFIFIDYLFSKFSELTNLRINKFKYDKKLNSQFAKLVIDKNELILVKPQTFMNRSGEAVRKVIENWKLKIENLIVAHDDLDISLGKFKIQKGTGPLLHNGIESIENHLHTKDFWRVRIGVDNRKTANRINGETYVLQNFQPEEKEIIDQTFSPIYSAITNRFGCFSA